MAGITAGTGLVSGLNYSQIIDSLVALEKQPVDLLTTQLQKQQSIQAAYTGLSATLLSMSLSVNQLGQSSVLNARQASSSNPAVLEATANSTAVAGTYTFRPIQQAQAQRFTSAGFAAQTSLVGAGTVTIKRGGFVTGDTPIEALNGGAGIARGKIRITDRSGSSTVVDLSGIRTVGDVLSTINDNGSVAVTASVSGDSIVLTDRTGSTSQNLSVQEVGSGTTAADLGLLGSVAAATKTGSDIVRLGNNLQLSNLNDGMGVRTDGTLDDLRVTLKDGSQIDVKLAGAKTIGDVLTAINTDSQNTGTLVASLSAGGNSLVLTDTSGGGGTLTVSALNGSKSAQDLGILGTEQAGGVLTGKRTLAGLNSVLLGSLRGGQGITTPGQIQLTDRTGATATVDLTNAVSLSDVVTAINASGLAINAAVNTQNHGITLTDASGATASNLIVADVGGGTTATDLNIAADVASTAVQSGDLHRRYVDEATLLSKLNGGAGLAAGSIKITDKAGASSIINLSGNSFQDVGDVLAAINAAAVNVTATLNSTGDGILLTDASGGGGSLSVEEVGGGTTAASLRLKGSTTTTAIDGAFTYKVEFDADDTLNDAVVKLKQSGAPINASVFNTGGLNPYKLLLSSTQSGDVGRLVIDSGATGANFTQSQQGRDAVVELTGSGAEPVLFASSTNRFATTVQGVGLNLLGTSTSPISVTVADNVDSLSAVMKQFVTGFNTISTSITKQTAFDASTTTRGLLQGDGTATQLQSALFNLVGRSYGAGGNSIRNFAQLGLTIKGGQVSFDEAKLQAAMASDPDAVRNFFSDATSGAATVLKRTINSYTDSGTGTLFHRIDALDSQAKTLQDRIDAGNARVDRRKTLLENQFAALEKTLSSVQGQQSSLTALANLAASATNSGS